MEFSGVILGIVIGTLAAIVYSLRVLVLMERRIARIDSHIEALVLQVLTKEEEIQAEEKKIEQMITGLSKKSAPKKKATKKKASPKKKTTKKKSSTKKK
ncbi:MAG: hypothetical protein ACMXX9_01745 [Candidatus Woesearchaeota archaeon]